MVVVVQLAANGMLVLGCVAEVRDFELIVALPNGLRGSVAITDISNAYTSLLQQLASDDSHAATDDVNGLSFFSLNSLCCHNPLQCTRTAVLWHIF